MLLTRIVRAGRDDQGSGLVAVIALTVVTGIIGATVGAVTVHSLQTTNGVAGSVEARAAAQAGIADVEQLIRTFDAATFVNECPAGGVLEQSTTPAYRVEVYSDDLANGWTDVPTCPGIDSTRVKIVSTGFAERATPGAGAHNSDVTIEAIYQYIPQPAVVEAIDPAVYAYQIEGTLKNFELGIEPGTLIASDIQIRNGDFLCQNNARVSGSVVLGNGSATLKSCDIDGDLNVSGFVRLEKSGTSSEVAGDVNAAGIDEDDNPLSGIIAFLDKGATIGGDVSAGGNISIPSDPATRVGGTVTAARNSSTSITIESGARVLGNVLSSGTVTAPSGSVTGTISRGVTDLRPPARPIVPDWVNVPFQSDLAWIQASSWWPSGFQNIVTWSGDCTLADTDPRWAEIASYTQRTIIDATACTNGVITNSSLKPTIALQTDVAFFADSFSFDKLYATPDTTTEQRRMYFIVPDNNPNSEPSCEDGAGNIYYNNEDNIAAPLSLFFYSPCDIISDRNKMRGQIYGGEVEFRQQAQWTFVPSTPPGIDFSAGVTAEPVTAGAFLGSRLSIREISNGG